MMNRRKDGTLFEEEAVVSPIRDESGAITSFVAVKRDVTRERAAEAATERAARERALIAGTLAEVRAGPTPEVTAEAICRQLVSLPGAVTANLAYFTADGPVMPLAFVRADGVPGLLHRLPYQRSRAVRERCAEGPWVEAWTRTSVASVRPAVRRARDQGRGACPDPPWRLGRRLPDGHLGRRGRRRAAHRSCCRLSSSSRALPAPWSVRPSTSGPRSGRPASASDRRSGPEPSGPCSSRSSTWPRARRRATKR